MSFETSGYRGFNAIAHVLSIETTAAAGGDTFGELVCGTLVLNGMCFPTSVQALATEIHKFPNFIHYDHHRYDFFQSISRRNLESWKSLRLRHRQHKTPMATQGLTGVLEVPCYGG